LRRVRSMQCALQRRRAEAGDDAFGQHRILCNAPGSAPPAVPAHSRRSSGNTRGRSSIVSIAQSARDNNPDHRPLDS
jgi:hypothetical protein